MCQLQPYFRFLREKVGAKRLLDRKVVESDKALTKKKGRAWAPWRPPFHPYYGFTLTADGWATPLFHRQAPFPLLLDYIQRIWTCRTSSMCGRALGELPTPSRVPQQAQDSCTRQVLIPSYPVSLTFSPATTQRSVYIKDPRAQDREYNSKKVARYFRHNYSIWWPGW